MINWNCRGATSKAFPQIMKDMVNKYKVCMIAIYEPINGKKDERIIKRMGWNNSICVYACGFSGGK